MDVVNTIKAVATRLRFSVGPAVEGCGRSDMAQGVGTCCCSRSTFLGGMCESGNCRKGVEMKTCMCMGALSRT